MKTKVFLVAIALGLGSLSFAQDDDVLTSKNGHVILPEAGDYAIQMDATPILDFGLNVVNIMNNTGSTSQHPGFVSGFDQTLVGKYFLTDQKAIRAKVAINSGSLTTNTYDDDPLNPSNVDPDNVLIMSSKQSSMGILLGGGLEWRRGHNRLQGFYGAEAFLGFGSNSTKNSYEIEYNQTNQDSAAAVIGTSRILSDKSGTSITFGVRGFAGVEYFILPKISIGAEFGWGFGVTSSPRGSVETENWGIEPGNTSATDPYQYTETNEGNSSGSSSGFSVDNGLGGSAAITATFHF